MKLIMKATVSLSLSIPPVYMAELEAAAIILEVLNNPSCVGGLTHQVWDLFAMV